MKDYKESFSDIGRKVNRALANAKTWVLENKHVSLPAAAGVLILIVICVTVGLRGKNDSNQANVEGTQLQIENDSHTISVIPVPEVPLEENAYPELNALFNKYYTAFADGDVATIESCRNYVSEKEKIAIARRSEFFEKYTNLVCYTKPGPAEDSFVAYVYYEAKFYDFEELVPGITTFLVTRNDEGEYWIIRGEIDENVDNYIKAISLQEDVEELFNRVKVKYAEVEDANTDLKAFLAAMPEEVNTYAAEEIAKREGSGQVDGEQVTEPETETAAAAEEPVSVSTVQTVAATAVVNVRSSDSETADKLGKAQVGQEFKLLETRGNGWSKIEFEGKEAFVKSDYLTVVSEEAADNGAENQAGTGGSVTAKTTVNVRASANENGERLGTVYQGEKLELVMKQADGWTKVKYQGQTAYVKSEFVE